MRRLLELDKTLGGLTAQVTKVAFDYLGENLDLLVSTNQEQMYKGQDAFGKTISPKYSEDPYFRTPGEAYTYAAWKQRITPHPDRDWNTPNLFIRGDFYESVRAYQVGLSIRFNSLTVLGRAVTSKFPQVLGIDPDNQEAINENLILPEVLTYVNQAL